MGDRKRLKGPQALQQLDFMDFQLQGDVHHMVTFLNRTLKYRGLIFGLALGKEGGYTLTIYHDPTTDYQQREETNGEEIGVD